MRQSISLIVAHLNDRRNHLMVISANRGQRLEARGYLLDRQFQSDETLGEPTWTLGAPAKNDHIYHARGDPGG
jgi:hypothetical protein